ncbi:hypothetical protein ACA910_020996 [Epithemia clementina (nom. ined.)]
MLSATEQGGNTNAFKQAQIKHRRQAENPYRLDDSNNWIDFGRGTGGGGRNGNLIESCQVVVPSTGLHDENADGGPITGDDGGVRFHDDYYEGPIYTLSGAPGFFFAPQALHPDLQRWISFAAVTKYCEPPHVTNIDYLVPCPKKSSEAEENTTFTNRDEDTMWSLWKKELREDDQRQYDKKEANSCRIDTKSNSNAPKIRGSTITIQQQGSQPNKKNCKNSNNKSFQKLTWATMGYHYDWTSRAYHPEVKSDMPKLICDLSKLFATTALRVLLSSTSGTDNSSPPRSNNVRNDDDVLSYDPSACIVNYYNEKSLMGGHRDDLEYALDKPIVSLSFGLPAIFLLGGPTKEDTPIFPILVRPGDVMIMAGPSRLYYHGMARLLPRGTDLLPAVDRNRVASLPQQLAVMDQLMLPDGASGQSHDGCCNQLSPEDDTALQSYLCNHRININVRQVY